MNKASLTTLALAAFGIATASAGTGYVSMDKGPAPKAPAPMNVPTICSCFDMNTASVSVYAAGLLPDSTGGDLDDAFGAGLALDYFFTENVGIEVDATWAAEDSTVHLFTGSVVLRAPIKSICLAPYVFGGGGLHTNGVTQGVFHAGGGLDYRVANCWGVFADARYTWAEDTADYTLVRGGLRFAF